MKRITFLVILILCQLSACTSDDDGQEIPAQPTLFQGRVLYSDNNEPVSNAILRMVAFENVLFSGDNPIESLDATLNEVAEGNFNLTFRANVEIDNFFVGVDFYDPNTPGLIIGGSDIANGMVCSPISCVDFRPGNEYTDLTIIVPRPE